METASLVISIFALLVSLAVAWWIQNKMDKRELIKWRRDTMTKAVLDFTDNADDFDNMIVRQLFPLLDNEQDKIFELSSLFDKCHRSRIALEVCKSEHVIDFVKDRLKLMHKLLEDMPDSPVEIAPDDDRRELHQKYLDDLPDTNKIPSLLQKDIENV